MLSLSQVTGQDVWGSDGRVLGRVADLTTRLDDQAGPHMVERILVCRRGPDLLMPWAAIESFEHTGVLMHANDDSTRYSITSMLVRWQTTRFCSSATSSTPRSSTSPAADGTGRRRSPHGCANGRLELVGVEVGFGGRAAAAWLRRLAARTAGHRRLDRSAPDLRARSCRAAGHPSSAVHHLDAAGLAALISRLDIESATEVLALRGPRVAADASVPHPAVGERVLRAMPRRSRRADRGRHARRTRDPLAGPHRAHARVLGRRFIRSRVWPRRRHAPADGRRAGRRSDAVNRPGRKGFTLGALLAVVGPGLLAGLSDDDPGRHHDLFGARRGPRLPAAVGARAVHGGPRAFPRPGGPHGCGHRTGSHRSGATAVRRAPGRRRAGRPRGRQHRHDLCRVRRDRRRLRAFRDQSLRQRPALLR